MDLPDAPGDRPRRAGQLPDLRHGARAAHSHARGGRRRPPEGHDAALLGERRAQPAARRYRDGRDDLGRGGPPRDGRAGVRLGAVRARHAGRPLGRLAVLRARLGLVPHAPAQHVQPDRARRGRRVPVQRIRGARAERAARGVQGARARPALLRGGGGHHDAGVARRGARAAGALADLQRGARAARARAEHRDPRRGGRHGARGAARGGEAGRDAAGAAGLEDPGRRRGARRALGRRRVDDHRGAAAGRETRRRTRHCRHGESDWNVPDARGESRRRHAARADCPPRRRGGPVAGADSAARGPRVGLVRSRRNRGRGARRGHLGADRPGAAARQRARRRGVGADHRVPVRARARDPDLGHGRHRPRRARRRADQGRGGARDHGEGRHAGGRQDRHADRREAGAATRDRCVWVRRGRAAGAGREPRAGERASARRRDRRRRDSARPLARRGDRLSTR